MPAFPSYKKLKRGDSDYQFSTDAGCCKWMDNRSVVMLFSNIEGMQTKSLVQRVKGSAAKVSVSCPDVIKLCNKGVGELDLVDQRTTAYHLDRKSSIRFYLRIFFDLMDVACAKSYIACNMLHGDDLTLFNFTIAVATHIFGPYSSRKRTAPDNNIGSKTTYQYKHEPTEVQNLQEFQQNHHQCVYIVTQGYYF